MSFDNQYSNNFSNNNCNNRNNNDLLKRYESWIGVTREELYKLEYSTLTNRIQMSEFVINHSLFRLLQILKFCDWQHDINNNCHFCNNIPLFKLDLQPVNYLTYIKNWSGLKLQPHSKIIETLNKYKNTSFIYF